MYEPGSSTENRLKLNSIGRREAQAYQYSQSPPKHKSWREQE